MLFMHISLIFFDIVGKSADNFLLLGLSARLCLLKPFRTLNILVKTPPRFTYRLAKPRKRGKWRELRGAFGSAHTPARRFGTRHINHIVIFSHISLPCRNDDIVIINISHNKAVMTGMTAYSNFFIYFSKNYAKGYINPSYPSYHFFPSNLNILSQTQFSAFTLCVRNLTGV